MFGMFKKKSPIEKLEDQYQKLLDESYKLSHINRAESDKLRAKAEEVANEIDRLKESN